MNTKDATDINTLRHPPIQDEDCVEVGQFVQGNPQLPSRHTKIRFTPEMMREIKHCKEDIIHFAQNYFYIINLDKGRMCIDLYPVQKKMLRMMVEHNRFAGVTSRQFGKCFSKNTKIRVKYKPLNLSFNVKVGTLYNIMSLYRRIKRLFCLDDTLNIRV